MAEIFGQGIFLDTISLILAKYWKGELPKKYKGKGIEKILSSAYKDYIKGEDELEEGYEEFIDRSLGLMFSFVLGFRNVFRWKKMVEAVFQFSRSLEITTSEFLSREGVLSLLEEELRQK